MKFITHTQEELKRLHIKEDSHYLVEYINKDYFNAQETIERAKAKAIIHEDKIMFIVADPFGMERFVEQVRVITK